MRVMVTSAIVIAIPLAFALAACSSSNGTGAKVTAESYGQISAATTAFNIPTEIPEPTPTPTEEPTPIETPTPEDTVTSVAMQLQANTDGNGFSVITWSDTSGSGIEQATDVQGSTWRK